MPLRLAEHLEHDRPRERFWAVGPGALTGQELLAILLGTGTRGRDALAVAGEILARGDGSLRKLAALRRAVGGPRRWTGQGGSTGGRGRAGAARCKRDRAPPPPKSGAWGRATGLCPTGAGARG